MQSFADFQKQGAPTPTASGGMPSFAQFSASQPPQPTPEPSLLSKVGSAIASPFISAFTRPTDEITTPQKALDSFIAPDNSIGSDIINSWTKVGNDYANLAKNGGGAYNTNLAQTGLDAVNAFFTPVSSALSKVGNLPGVMGGVARFVNTAFSEIGQGGGTVGKATAQNIPFVSQATKDELTPVFEQLGALSAQIAAGTAGHEAYTKLAKHTSTVMTKLAADPTLKETATTPTTDVVKTQSQPPLPTFAQFTESQAKTETPVTASASPVASETAPGAMVDSSVANLSRQASNSLENNAQGTKPGALERATQEIQAGNTPPIRSRILEDGSTFIEDGRHHLEAARQLGLSDYPVEDVTAQYAKAPEPGSVEQLAETAGGWQPGTKAQFDTALEHNDAATVQKMLPNVPEAYKTEFADKINQLVGKETPKTGRTTQTLKPIEGTGDLKTRGAALSIEAGAIEKGLTDNLGSLPEYRTVNFKEMAPKIADAFAKDPEGARAIAMGEKAAPKGTTPEMFAVTLEKEATAKGDVQTLHDLANSKLTAAGTTMGQRIASYAQRDEHSVTDAIREVQGAREADLAKRGSNIQKDATERIKTSVRAKNTVKSWSDFVASIEC